MTMKLSFKRGTSALAMLCVGVSCCQAQMTQIIDQQCGGALFPLLNGSGVALQLIAQPYGQIFTPSLPEVGFITLNVADYYPGNGRGATLFIDLLQAQSGDATVAQSQMLVLPDGFRGSATFTFSEPAAVSPGDRYFFAPRVAQFTPSTDGSVAVKSDQWGLRQTEQYYDRGQLVRGGIPAVGLNIWFREGIAVPEPSSVTLLLLACGVLMLERRFRGSSNHSCERTPIKPVVRGAEPLRRRSIQR